MMAGTLLREAWISIGSSKLRTFLAMLGIVIGVGSVILMVAIGNGSRRSVQEAIDAMGSNQLIVSPAFGLKEVMHGAATPSLAARGETP